MKRIFILILIFACLVFLNIFFFKNSRDSENLILKVIFLDIGQGDGILIETPDKKQILIDAGPDSKILRSIKKHISFYDRNLDLLIATHYDLDHIGGFGDILKRFNIKSFGHYSREESGDYVNYLKDLIQDENLEYEYDLYSGQEFILDSKNNIKLKILWPPENYDSDDRNDSSVVVRLVYGDISFLFTGDAGEEIENYLFNYFLKEDLKNNVLKAGHHGSKTSTSLEFLNKVLPEYSIISAGLNNKFDHPHQEVIDNLNTINSKILSTIDSGSIIFYTDGKNLWNELEK